MLDVPVVHAAREMQGALLEQAADIESNRRVPLALAQSLASAGAFRMLVPKEYGGLEVHPRVMVEVLYELARADGATAWHVMTGATTGLFAAYLPEAGAKEVWSDPAVILSGVFAPMGRAKPEGDGYRLSGRWPFTSGCDNASWRMGSALVDSGGERPELISMFFPANESTIIDTWKTSGLRGTGSHDVEVTGILVPEHRCATVLGQSPTVRTQLYSFPIFGLLAHGVSAIGLGIARAALDEIYRLAEKKKSGGRGGSLLDRDYVQIELARAEAELAAGRALVAQTLDSVWEEATGEALPGKTKAKVRLAATHAVRCATRTVDTAYRLGGGSAIYDKSPLQRHFRDMHTVTAHVMVNTESERMIGRVLTGKDSDSPQL